MTRPMIRLFDTHCHVHDERMPGGTAAAVEAAAAVGVSRMVTVGCDRATSEAAIRTAAEHADVWATVGVHPHEATKGTASVADLIDAPRVVAVGEAGLDYYYEHSPRDTQRQVFAEHVRLAHEHGLPLVIHTRDAWDDTFDVLDREGVPDRTIFHCFTGGPDEARRCLDRGAYVSISGIVTFKNADDVRAAADLVPDDRLLIETDAPYLAPVPHRGRTNQPAFLAATAQALADRREMPLEDFAATTHRNGCRAFGLPEDHGGS